MIVIVIAMLKNMCIKTCVGCGLYWQQHTGAIHCHVLTLHVLFCLSLSVPVSLDQAYFEKFECMCLTSLVSKQFGCIGVSGSRYNRRLWAAVWIWITSITQFRIAVLVLMLLCGWGSTSCSDANVSLVWCVRFRIQSNAEAATLVPILVCHWIGASRSGHNQILKELPLFRYWCAAG